MPDELDSELLRLFVQGDRDAFESLFRQFEVEVYRWILRIVRDASAAEDVLSRRVLASVSRARGLTRREISVLGCGE
jgi:DNA-directed RNA polymerase specialized sigma24 family protein